MSSLHIVSAIACALFLSSSGCGGQTANTAGAAVGAAAMHAGFTGLHRAATGACWGDCAYGTTCNHETGVCEPIPEDRGGAAVAGVQAAASVLPPAPAPSSECAFADPNLLAEKDRACVVESSACTFRHDECTGTCRCTDAVWQCDERCR